MIYPMCNFISLKCKENPVLVDKSMLPSSGKILEPQTQTPESWRGALSWMQNKCNTSHNDNVKGKDYYFSKDTVV